VAAEEEETGVNGGGGDRHGEWWTLEFFWDESQTTRGGQLFIGSKISKAVLKLEPPLIILELISGGTFGLKTTRVEHLSAMIQVLNRC
jgi:hypothetical protein